MRLLLLILLFPLRLFSQDDSTIIWQQNHYQDTLAPKFALTDVNGNYWNSDSLRGKTIVLNFWSVYCPGCFHELPELNKLPAQFSPDSVVFISVLYEKGPRADSVIAKHTFSYHVATGGLQIMSDYYNNCFPTHVIIDRNGMIRYNTCGVVDVSMLLPEIRRISER